MNQYQNQYGTVYAVRDYKGAPQIMCRAKDDGDWLISGTLAVQAAAAKTADEMQAVLDQHATAHGWQPVDEQAPASAEPPEIVDEGSGPEEECPYLQPLENSKKYNCQCSICGEKFTNREICNRGVRFCGWYLNQKDKEAQVEDDADADGFPDWVRPMVEAFLRFPFFRELPAFTAFAIRHSEPVQHRQGGSLADGLYDTDSKGIKFSAFRSDNSDQYREAHYTWADFVRRCKAAGLAPEQLHQDKEDAPCNTETPAPTGAAAATTGVSAAPEPSKTAETTATSESGADAGTSMSQESGTSGPSTLPARGCPAGTGDAAQGNSESAPLTTPPSGSSAFDYTGLNAQTVADLHLAEREFAAGRRLAEIGLRRMADGVAIAHDALCVTIATKCRNGNGAFSDSEKTFGRWCESVGLNRKAAERLLQVSKLFDASTPREQGVLEELGPSLLYAAAKPSAPAELVQAVRDGDITTHKQYQDLLAQYNAERAARERAEHEAAMDRKEQEDANAAALRYKSECDRRAQDQQRLEGLISTAQRARDAALRRAAEAEKQRDGARDALQAAKLRGDKWQAEAEALKAQPVEAQVVDEEEIDRRARARADELTAPLREELEALRNRHPADLEEAEQAIRDAYDSAVYTGRVIESAWRSLCPLLPRMDADRRELALNQIVKIISTIQGECIQCL